MLFANSDAIARGVKQTLDARACNLIILNVETMLILHTSWAGLIFYDALAVASPSIEKATRDLPPLSKQGDFGF